MLRRLCCLSFLLPLSLCQAGDWPGWLGPNRDNSATEEVRIWTEPLKTLWRKPVGEGHSSPIVASGRVFLHTKVAGEETEQVEAFDAASGKRVWSQTYARPKFANEYGNGPRSTPLFHDGRLYTLGVTGILSCWDAASGKLHWRHDLLKELATKNLYFGISTAPLIVDDLLLVMVGPGATLAAFDRKTGERRYVQGEDAASYSSPVLLKEPGPNAHLALLTAEGVRFIEPKTGKSRWFFAFKDKLNESSSTPVQAGGKLIVSSVTAGSVCIDLNFENGVGMTHDTEAWRQKALTCYFGTPVVVGSEVYLVTGGLPPFAQANLHCVELASGKVLWTKRKVGTYHATLLKTRDKMLMLEEGGDLVLLEPNAKEFKELARSKICGNTWAHPALADGKLFVRDGKELSCVELK